MRQIGWPKMGHPKIDVNERVFKKKYFYSFNFDMVKVELDVYKWI